MDQKGKAYLDRSIRYSREHLAWHKEALAIGRKTISGASGWPSFQECLSEVRDIVLILEITHSYRLTRLNKSPDDSHMQHPDWESTVSAIFGSKHPHWELVLSKLYEKLYPAASLMPDEPINLPFVPVNMAYELMLKGLLNLSDPQKIQDHLNDPIVMLRYIGDQTITISEYLSAWSFNVTRLMAQKYEDAKSISLYSEQTRNTPAEAAIFYVATNISVQRAIAYLEALWESGWLHDVPLYALLWLGLQMRHRSHPEESMYRKGRIKYVEEIIFFDQNTIAPVAEFLTAARDLLKRTKKVLSEDRTKASNLSHWIGCLHKHLLSFTGISLLKEIAERKHIINSHKSQDHLFTELTQIWRYCMEAAADIMGFIGNPFTKLVETMGAIEYSSNKLELERNLRFFNGGRIGFPEIFNRKIIQCTLSDARIAHSESAAEKEIFLTNTSGEKPWQMSIPEVSYEHREKLVADLILSDLGQGLQEAYTSVYSVTGVDMERRDLPEGIDPPTAQDNYLHLPKRCQKIVICLQGCRYSFLAQPIADVVSSCTFGLDSTTELRCSYENGSPIELRFTDTSAENNLTASDKQANYPKDKITEENAEAFIHTILKTEIRRDAKVNPFNILPDLLRALEYIESHSQVDIRKLRRIFIDTTASSQILRMEIEDGTVKEFGFTPRQLPAIYEKGNIESITILVLEMTIAHVFLYKQRSELLFRGQPLKEIPVKLYVDL